MASWQETFRVCMCADTIVNIDEPFGQEYDLELTLFVKIFARLNFREGPKNHF